MNDKITIIGIVAEDFVQYRNPSMVVMFPTCTFKCEKEAGCKMCQNSELATYEKQNVDVQYLYKCYEHNDITRSVVLSGLEPFDSFDDVMKFVRYFRSKTDDDIVIYTGYYYDEISEQIKQLQEFCNIVIKFGRFVPNSDPIYSNVLGIQLASKNQYAERIS